MTTTVFVAIRELRSARWRFALVTGVVFLLALLVAGLSGLTSGLAHQNVSAVQALGDGRFAVAEPGGASPDLDRSALTSEQVSALSAGSDDAAPVGIARVSMTDSEGRAASVVVLGLSRPLGALTPPADGSVLVSPGAARTLGSTPAVTTPSGDLPVAGTAADLWHAHTPVVVTDLTTWHRLAPRGGEATLVALQGSAAPVVAGTTTVDADGLLEAMPSYQAEHGSLTLMTGMLLAISALVAGAFFTVWGMQRSRDVAVLKALGESTRSLVAGTVGQAGVVLVAGVGLGVGLAALAGLVVPTAVPYVVSTSTTVLPAAALVGLGLLGAVAALRPVLAADPTTALGALR